jgi:uncharacterized membrane protein YoaK (UPF0700 family)
MKIFKASLISTLLFDLLLFILGLLIIDSDSTQRSWLIVWFLYLFFPIFLFYLLLNYVSSKYQIFNKLMIQYTIGALVSLVLIISALFQVNFGLLQKEEIVKGFLLYFIMGIIAVSINILVKKVGTPMK